MQADDPHILAAMDGSERTPISDSVIKPPGRNEPRAFFFVIFGLVYEALATSSADSTLTTSARQPAVIAALGALKCLVRPEYSGKAMLESTTFDEFVNLCYRMAMTEPAGIQVHLVETVAALAASQDTSTLANTR